MDALKGRKLLLMRLFHFGLAVLLIVLDQISKYFVRRDLSGGRDIVLIKGVFRFTFLKNTGAVWGIFSGLANPAIFLTVITFIILGIILVLYFKVPAVSHYQPVLVILCFIVAGAIGNLIDRIMLGYVTDFLYFELINFPVFNVADCYITVSCFLLVILMLTKYRNDDLDFLSFKKNHAE